MKKTSLAAFAAYFAISVLITACGGSGGSSETPSMASGTISGTAFDSELTGADVFVSGYDGMFYGKATTDSEGRFSVDVTSESQVLRIETKGGSFVDEFTGKTYQELFGLNDGALRLYLNYTAGTSLVVAPTIYTTLAAELADYLIGQGVNPAAAVSQANTTFSSILGIDIESTVPHNVTREPTAGISTASIEYGFLCAAISAMVAQLDQRPIEFTKIAGDDIAHDGLLDEVAPAGSAVLALGEGGYRHALALGVLRMMASKRNRTGWGIDTVLPLAERLNSSVNGIFGNGADDIVPLESIKPTIAQLSWWYDAVHFNTAVGIVELTFSVEDAVGIQSIDVTVGDQSYSISDIHSPTLSLNTVTLPDGIQPIAISAKNALGMISTHESTLRIANHGTAIVHVQPGNGHTVAGNVAFSAEITDPTGIAGVEFFIDGNRFSTPAEALVRTANYFTPQLDDGNHVFTVKAKNGVGAVAEQSVAFVTDNTAPSIEFWLAPGAYLEGVVTLVVMHDSDSNVTLRIGDVTLPNVGREIGNGKAFSSFLLDTQRYADSNYEIAAKAIDFAGNSSTRNISFYVDNTPPDLRFTLPRSGDSISGEFYLAFQASDASGFSDKPFEILIDNSHTAWISNDWRSDTINPARYGRGWHQVTLIVEDASGKKAMASQNLYFDI